MKVIVGLGNPGKEYSRTRHNVGWLLLDQLIPRLNGGRFRAERSVEVAEAFHSGEKIYLLKPQTFMNRSGQALAMWLGAFRDIREALRDCAPAPRPRPESNGDAKGEKAVACVWPGLLVVSDDVNLPLGRLRLRPSGSAGGHNGLKDIEKALGGQGYPRLRLGVGAPPDQMDRADYVLGRFATAEMPAVDNMMEAAEKATVDWLDLGLDAARDKYNGIMPKE